MYRKMRESSFYRIIGYSATLVMHTANIWDVRNALEAAMDNPDVQIFTSLQHVHYTSWNIALQLMFATLCLICELLVLVSKGDYKIPECVINFRDTLFTSFIWPSSLITFVTFWSFYLYDKSLVMPSFYDEVLRPINNHIAHTAILAVVLWEFSCQPRNEPKSHALNVVCTSVYGIFYVCMVHVTQAVSGNWAYPFLEKCSGTLLLPTYWITSFCALIMLYFIHWYLAAKLQSSQRKASKKIL